MQIESDITHRLSVDVDEPFTSSRGWTYNKKGALLVEIRTTDGIVGRGDCSGPAAANRSAVGLAATLQLLAALPDRPPCLHPIPPLLDYEQTFNPFRDELAGGPLTHERGIVQIPNGLGIEIDREMLARYRVA